MPKLTKTDILWKSYPIISISVPFDIFITVLFDIFIAALFDISQKINMRWMYKNWSPLTFFETAQCYVMLVTQLIYFLAQSGCKKKLRNCSVWLPLNCGEREKALFERKNIKNNLTNECVLQGWHIALPCVEWCS